MLEVATYTTARYSYVAAQIYLVTNQLFGLRKGQVYAMGGQHWA